MLDATDPITRDTFRQADLEEVASEAMQAEAVAPEARTINEFEQEQGQ